MQSHIFEITADPAPWELVLEQARLRAGLGTKLYWCGATALLETTSRVAFAGTREAEEWTLAATEGLAGLVASHGGCIVSGGALGTDSAAHRGALQSGGTTIVVLPVPLETVDPSRFRHSMVAQWDLNRTLFISPFPRGTHTRASHPIIRNRLIAALGGAAVVGQTRPRSGTNHFLGQARSLRLPRFLLDAPGGNDEVAAALRAMKSEGVRLFDERDAYSTGFAREIVGAARKHNERTANDEGEQLWLCEAPEPYGEVQP